jgi:hypothetical protein
MKIGQYDIHWEYKGAMIRREMSNGTIISSYPTVDKWIALPRAVCCAMIEVSKMNKEFYEASRGLNDSR